MAISTPCVPSVFFTSTGVRPLPLVVAHLALLVGGSDADRQRALSRSLRFFGLAFQGRQCPTVDEDQKRILFIGGLPPTSTAATVKGMLERVERRFLPLRVFETGGA